MTRTNPVIHRDLWDHNPSLAANTAAHRLLDASSKETSVTLDEAQRAIADVVGHALANPNPAVQNNAMDHFVIPTLRSNQSLIMFGSRVNDAWRTYAAVRDAVANPGAMAALGATEASTAAALAGARKAFDDTVVELVGEYVAHLAMLPPRNPIIDGLCAAAGAVAVEAARKWQIDEGLRLAGLQPRSKE